MKIYLEAAGMRTFDIIYSRDDGRWAHHTLTFPTYREMLAAWNSFDQRDEYEPDELAAILMEFAL